MRIPDTSLHLCLQRASVTTEVIAATLNAGQAIVLALGLTSVLMLAAYGSGTGASRVAMTAGDLVRGHNICCLDASVRRTNH